VPLDLRAQREAAARRINVDTARADIVAAERESAAQARLLFEIGDWNDPVHYDLVLNTGRLGIGECADVIVRAAAGRDTPDAVVLLRDQAIAASVHAALARERALGALGLEVHAAKGRVTLGGAVIGGALADRACAVAASVPGVREVVCESAEPVPIPPVERM
jgi:hypothetical protein